MIVIYTIPGCPYCSHALEILKKLKIKVKNVHVASNKKRFYSEKHKMCTFPQIFYVLKGKEIKIGGCDDLIKFINLCNVLNKLPWDQRILCEVAFKLKGREIKIT